MVAFDFRPKIKGWRSSDWRMTFRNGKTIEGPYYYYYYYYYFQSSLILRDCCYSCRRVLNDNADITIADFWGIGKYQPENKDQEGISLIISHSQRANEILKSLSGFEYLDPLPESSVQYITNEVNHREILWEDHNKFMEDVKKNGYMKCAVKGAWKKILFLKFKMKMHSLLKTVIHNG